MAADRQFGLVALGYSNGLIKITKSQAAVALSPGCQREVDIVNAHPCEVAQLCFWVGQTQEQGTLLSIDAQNLIKQWDLSGNQPVCVKSSQLREQDAFCSCLASPTFLSSDSANHDHAFIGMTSGDLHFYSFKERRLLRHCVRRE
jgi:hypothetical protein